MAWDKDIRYTEKKVDESWKDQADKGKQGGPHSSTGQSESKKGQAQDSRTFLGLLNSLAYQVMLHLGELQTEAPGAEVNLEAAKEVIDLLNALKEKTSGNQGLDEARFFNSILPELQMKYVQMS